MSAFYDDLAKNMSSPEFAYEFGRTERELEIINLLETWSEQNRYDETLSGGFRLGMGHALDLIKGEQ